VQSDEAISKAGASSRRLNQHLMNLAKGSADVTYLASPVTGGGIHVGRLQQLFLLSLQQGHKLPQEWVQDTWAVLHDQGHRIVKAGQPLQTEQENLAELELIAHDFQKKALPMLRGLGVI
jgi:hypothetical protein